MAIKVLEIYTSKESFVNEVNIWKSLKHRNILELYGASSAEGPIPWFLVSPFMEHGSLTEYLRRMEWEEQKYLEARDAAAVAGTMREKVDFLRLIRDIAAAMSYLHENGVYHGDLKVCALLLIVI